MNPVALTFWVFATCCGYLVGDLRGAVWGLAIASGISSISNLFAIARR